MRATLRRTLRQQLELEQPPLRTFAQGVLAEGSRIDLVAKDPLGGAVVILIADAGQDRDLLTRALAHRSWVEQRIPDWLQLAPELELSASVSALLLCPEFHPETIAAARSVQPLVRLSLYRSLQDAAGPVLLEPLLLGPEKTTSAPVASLSQPQRSPGRSPGGSSSPPSDSLGKPTAQPSEFRSGLSEADLQITPEERREFT